MESSLQLAHRFRDVVLQGTWIANTNIKEQLLQVDWQQATTQIASVNTLAALTFHLNYYIEGLVTFFEGGKLTIRDKHSFEMQEIASQEAWEQLRDSLFDHAEAFAQAVEAMTEEQLAAIFIEQKYGNYRRNVEGIIEHCYYHFGQITLIRKLLDASA